MKKILLLFWVTTFVWLVSAGPLPQRKPHSNTKFLNPISTRSRHITTSPPSSPPPAVSSIATTTIRNPRRVALNSERSVVQFPINVASTVTVPNTNIFATEKVVRSENNTISSPLTDDVLNYNYDYDYLSFLYDLDFLNLENETKVDTSSPNEESSVKDSMRQGKLLNNELVLNPRTMGEERKELIKQLRFQTQSIRGKLPRLKIPRPFRYTTTSPALKEKNAFKEPRRIKSSLSTPTSSLLTSLRPIQQEILTQKPEESANSPKEFTNKNNSNSSLNDHHITTGWKAESSVSVEVRVESSHQKESQIPRPYFGSSSEPPFQKVTPNKNPVQNIRNRNNMRLREVLELEVSATPKVIDLRPGVISTEKTKLSTQVTTALPKRVGRVKELISESTPSPPKTIATTTTTRTTPTTLTSKIKATIKTSTVPPSVSELSLDENLYATTENVVPSHETSTSRFISPRTKIINASSSPVANRGNITQRRPPLSNPRNISLSRTRPRTYKRGKQASFLVSRHVTSQLGLNPHGIHPSGITPFGLHPQGLAPFGLSPYGLSPLGYNNTKRTNASSVPGASIKLSDQTRNQTLNSTNGSKDEVKEERYHVQVKKPDGSINGDYVVLDPNTGSLSGVRYEAIDGADQDLIQQALLSFLSLDPRLDPRPKSSQSNSRPLRHPPPPSPRGKLEVKRKGQNERRSESPGSESRRIHTPKRSRISERERLSTGR